MQVLAGAGDAGLEIQQVLRVNAGVECDLPEPEDLQEVREWVTNMNRKVTWSNQLEG